MSFWLTSCASRSARPTPHAPRSTLHATPYEATDDVGVTVRFASAPQRILSLSPAQTEILFALGAQDRIVGVSSYCDYPPEVRSIPKVGEILNPSLERIVELRPDLVVAERLNSLEVIQRLQKDRVPMFTLDPKSYEDIISGIERLARLIGEPEAGEALAAKMRDARDQVEQRSNVQRPTSNVQRPSPVAPRPRVLFSPELVVGQPIWLPGPGTFHDDIITICGGENVASDASLAWSEYGLEAVVARQPEVILSTYPEGADKEKTTQRLLAAMRAAAGWRELPAVRQGRVYLFPVNAMLRPGPRLADLLPQIVRAILPDVFAEGKETAD